ncbi:hypothetical protein BpHYR1_027375, partial [Brachionus plicatilis]
MIGCRPIHVITALWLLLAQTLFDVLAGDLKSFGAVRVKGGHGLHVGEAGVIVTEPIGGQFIAQIEHYRRHSVLQRLAHKRRDYGPRLEQVRMIAHLSQLHEYVYNGHVVALGYFFSSRAQRHELVVEQTLSLAQRTLDHVFVLFGHLFFHMGLQTTQYERSKDFVQPFDQLFVNFGIVEPVVELTVRGEHVRHQKVHERPQFHQVVLERCACEQKATLRLKVEQRLPPLGLEVFDVLRFVQYEVLPLFAPEYGVVLNDQFVAGDAHVERVCLGPADALQLALFLRAV